MPLSKSKRKKHKHVHASKVESHHSNVTSLKNYRLSYLLFGVALIVASLAMFFMNMPYSVKGITFLLLFSFGVYTLFIAREPH